MGFNAIALQTLSGDLAFEGLRAALMARVEGLVVPLLLVLLTEASFLADFLATFRSIINH